MLPFVQFQSLGFPFGLTHDYVVVLVPIGAASIPTSHIGLSLVGAGLRPARAPKRRRRDTSRRGSRTARPPALPAAEESGRHDSLCVRPVAGCQIL